MDILFISLPSYWGRKYVYVENYWMIEISQYFSSYGYKVKTLDASLHRSNLIDIQRYILQNMPKIIVYLVSKKNWKVVKEVKELIETENNILLWDDSFSINEVSNYIPNDKSTINANLDSLFNIIKNVLPCSQDFQLYTDEVFLVGRDSLSVVMLAGGECEVIAKMPEKTCFPSDYYFQADHSAFVKNIESVHREIVILCCKFNLRKINIIDNNLSHDIENILEYGCFLNDNNLSYVKIGIYILSDCFSKKMFDYLLKAKAFIYKIIIRCDVVSRDQIEGFSKLRGTDIKVKLLVELFNENATIDSVKLIISLIRQGIISVSPTALISGTPSNQSLKVIQRIMRIIFYNAFFSYYERIIEYENNEKYELRTKKSTNYSSIPIIQKQVDLLSKSLNDVLLGILEELILYSILGKEISKNNIIYLLDKYNYKIKKIGDEIDVSLFNSHRI